MRTAMRKQQDCDEDCDGGKGKGKGRRDHGRHRSRSRSRGEKRSSRSRGDEEELETQPQDLKVDLQSSDCLHPLAGLRRRTSLCLRRSRASEPCESPNSPSPRNSPNLLLVRHLFRGKGKGRSAIIGRPTLARDALTGPVLASA
jgi:hypothetical protein